LEKRFVVKHIHNKHGGKLDEQRAAIREELFWEAYERHHRALKDSAAGPGTGAGAMIMRGGGGDVWQVRGAAPHTGQHTRERDALTHFQELRICAFCACVGRC
jgi:hypothetical protein